MAGADEPTARAHSPQWVHCPWLAWERVKLVMSVLRLPASLLPCRPELLRAVGNPAAEPLQGLPVAVLPPCEHFPAFNTKKEKCEALRRGSNS